MADLAIPTICYGLTGSFEEFGGPAAALGSAAPRADLDPVTHVTTSPARMARTVRRRNMDGRSLSVT